MTLFLRFRRATLLLTRGAYLAPYAISRRLRRRSSACDTSAALRRWRFRLGCFLVRMWLLYAWWRRKRPLPVSRTRFRSARLDFCLGIETSLSAFSRQLMADC